MRNSWSAKEDLIVCKFYLSHIDTWRSYIDNLMVELTDAGFGTRDKGAVIMRIQNYAYLHTGCGLSNASNQSCTIYKAVNDGKL